MFQERPKFGFVPRRLIVEGRPELSIFALNILCSVTVREGDKQYFTTLLYEPDLSTFREGAVAGILAGKSSMTYYPKCRRDKWITLECDGVKGSYEGRKYRDGIEVMRAMGGGGKAGGAVASADKSADPVERAADVDEGWHKFFGHLTADWMGGE